MTQESLTNRLLTIAGIGTWIAVGLPLWSELVGLLGQTETIGWNWWLWILGHHGFGVLFISDTTGKLARLRAHQPLLMLLMLTSLATIALLAQPRDSLTAILFIITAVEVAHLVPLQKGILWILAQSLVVAIASMMAYDNLFAVVVQTMIYFGFQIFSLFSTYATVSEAKAREELVRLNAELRATQELITESSRMAERLRIARDLHDLIGHHLTALSLQLEVANHVANERAKEPIAQARSLARLLLSDVRDVVSTMREDDTVNLKKALISLTKDIPKPHIHLTMPEQLDLSDPNRAQAIVRCVQEVITNAIKHAHAENLWITLSYEEDTLRVQAHDDGRGSQSITIGNGLKGMRERLESLGGHLYISSGRGQGFQLKAQLPR